MLVAFVALCASLLCWVGVDCAARPQVGPFGVVVVPLVLKLNLTPQYFTLTPHYHICLLPAAVDAVQAVTIVFEHVIE